MRYFYLFFFITIPAWSGTVICTGVSNSDSYAIQTSLNAGGTTTLANTGHHCAIGVVTLQTSANNTILTTTTAAQIDYSGSGYALNINHNGVTVSNIVWNGGGLHTTQASTSTPQSGVTITGNTFNNIVNGSNAIQSDGYWSSFNITNNAFNTISTVPLAAVTANTNIENGGGGYSCTYPGGCYGIGIDNENGMTATLITNNTFNFTMGDAIRIAYNWVVSAGTTYHTASGNSISYNRFTNIHRMAIESQGASGSCFGTCIYQHSLNIAGMKIAGNFAYNFVAPYGNTFAYSVPAGANAPYIINNTGVISATGYTGYGLEGGNYNEITQGNVFSSADTSTPWLVYLQSGWTSTGYTITRQNNYLTGALRGGGAYLGSEGTNYGGTFINQYNMTAPDCQTPSNCQSSTLVLAFSSAANQSFPAHGNGTWSIYVTDQISVKNVQFFLDNATVSSETQELQDLNTNFPSDRRWLYHYTFDTAALTSGSHTIKAVATDVSGAASTATQSFTVGTGGSGGGIGGGSTGAGTPLAVGSYNIQDAGARTADGGFIHYTPDNSIYLYSANNGIDQKITFTAAGKLMDAGTGLYFFNSGGVLKQGPTGDTFTITKPSGSSGYTIQDGGLYLVSPNVIGSPNTIHFSTTPYTWTFITAP